MEDEGTSGSGGEVVRMSRQPEAQTASAVEEVDAEFFDDVRQRDALLLRKLARFPEEEAARR
jgi:hypothetical protein